MPSAFEWPGNGGGAVDLIATEVAASSAAIDFTDLSSEYFSYIIEGSNIVPSFASARLFMRTSSNNGVSFDSGASDYAYGFTQIPYGTAIPSVITGSAADTLIEILGNLRTTASDAHSFIMQAQNLSNTTAIKRFYYSAQEIDDPGIGANTDYLRTAGGLRRSTSAINAIRFTVNSGVITSGTFKLYGLRAA